MLVGVYHNWVIGDDPEWSPAYVTQTAFNANLHYPFNLRRYYIQTFVASDLTEEFV